MCFDFTVPAFPAFALLIASLISLSTVSFKTSKDSALVLSPFFAMYSFTALLTTNDIFSAAIDVIKFMKFLNIAVYDCRIKPNPKDNSSVARILIINFENLLQDFDKL